MSVIISAEKYRNCSQLLGLDEGKSPSFKDIKSAYQEKIKSCHPDLNPDDSDSKEKFQNLRKAVKILIEHKREKNEVFDNNLTNLVDDELLNFFYKEGLVDKINNENLKVNEPAVVKEDLDNQPSSAYLPQVKDDDSMINVKNSEKCNKSENNFIPLKGKMTKKELRRQNYLRQKEAEEMKEELVLKMKEEAEKEQKRQEKKAEERKKLMKLQNESLVEQAASLLKDGKRKDKKSGTDDCNSESKESQKEAFSSSCDNNVVVSKDINSEPNQQYDDIWDEDCGIFSNTTVDAIWGEEETPKNSDKRAQYNTHEEEICKSIQRNQKCRNVNNQNKRGRQQSSFDNNKNNYSRGIQAKTKSYQSNYGDNQNRSSNYYKRRPFRDSKTSSSKPQQDSVWDAPTMHFSTEGVVEAPLPDVNVWEERQAKHDSIEDMLPHNDLEEEAMLRRALEMSRRQALEEEKMRRHLEEEYELQMKYLALAPDCLKEVGLMEDGQNYPINDNIEDWPSCATNKLPVMDSSAHKSSVIDEAKALHYGGAKPKHKQVKEFSKSTWEAPKSRTKNHQEEYYDDGWDSPPVVPENIKHGEANFDDGWDSQPDPVISQKVKHDEANFDDGWDSQPDPIISQKVKHGEANFDDGWGSLTSPGRKENAVSNTCSKNPNIRDSYFKGKGNIQSSSKQVIKANEIWEDDPAESGSVSPNDNWNQMNNDNKKFGEHVAQTDYQDSVYEESKENAEVSNLRETLPTGSWHNDLPYQTANPSGSMENKSVSGGEKRRQAKDANSIDNGKFGDHIMETYFQDSVQYMGENVLKRGIDPFQDKNDQSESYFDNGATNQKKAFDVERISLRKDTRGDSVQDLPKKKHEVQSYFIKEVSYEEMKGNAQTSNLKEPTGSWHNDLPYQERNKSVCVESRSLSERKSQQEKYKSSKEVVSLSTTASPDIVVVKNTMSAVEEWAAAASKYNAISKHYDVDEDIAESPNCGENSSCSPANDQLLQPNFQHSEQQQRFNFEGNGLEQNRNAIQTRILNEPTEKSEMSYNPSYLHEHLTRPDENHLKSGNRIDNLHNGTGNLNLNNQQINFGQGPSLPFIPPMVSTGMSPFGSIDPGLMLPSALPLNPAMASPLLFQQMLLCSNPFFMQQLHALQMYYASMGMAPTGNFFPVGHPQAIIPQQNGFMVGAGNQLVAPVTQPTVNSLPVNNSPSKLFPYAKTIEDSPIAPPLPFEQCEVYGKKGPSSLPPGIDTDYFQAPPDECNILLRTLHADEQSSFNTRPDNATIPPPKPFIQRRKDLQLESKRQPKHGLDDLYPMLVQETTNQSVSRIENDGQKKQNHPMKLPVSGVSMHSELSKDQVALSRASSMNETLSQYSEYSLQNVNNNPKNISVENGSWKEKFIHNSDAWDDGMNNHTIPSVIGLTKSRNHEYSSQKFSGKSNGNSESLQQNFVRQNQDESLVQRESHMNHQNIGFQPRLKHAQRFALPVAQTVASNKPARNQTESLEYFAVE